MDAVEISNLVAGYSKKTIKNCSFNIKEGEVFGLLGSNGAGKSTILSILSGILKNFDGQVKVFNRNIKEDKSVLNEISFVPQNPALFLDLTVNENLDFFAKMDGISSELRKERIAELMDKFSLNQFSKIQASKLSGGYKQLLNIAISTLIEKKIILLDEPTVGLDLWAKNKILTYIKELKSKGKTVVITTHDLIDAQEVCDNVLILFEGQIMANGNIHELLTKHGGGYTIRLSYTGLLKNKPNLKCGSIILFSNEELIIKVASNQIAAAFLELTSFLKNEKVENISLDLREPSLELVFSNLQK